MGESNPTHPLLTRRLALVEGQFLERPADDVLLVISDQVLTRIYFQASIGVSSNGILSSKIRDATSPKDECNRVKRLLD
jgi:hypothetical protein